MPEVMLVLKRDAGTDPPEHAGPVMTNRGPGWWPLVDKPEWQYVHELSFGLERMDPQPSWWLDIPQGAEGEGLTVEDLETAHDAAQMLTGSDFHKRDWPRMYRCQDRLRAALDALGGTS